MLKKRVLVIGDSCTDRYVYGRSEKLCPDAPVPVLIPSKTIKNGGMAKNVCSNILSLGAECDILTNKEKVVKTRYVDEKTNHMFIRVDTNEEKIKRVKLEQLNHILEYEAIVISDYDKGFLTKEDMKYIFSNHNLVFMDTKKPLGEWNRNCNFIKVNELEYNISKHFYPPVDDVLYKSLIVTLGNKGCRYKDKRFPVKEVDVKDMTGAGDSFLAGLVVEYLKTRNIEKSIKFANECATQVVQKKGVVTIE